ncbi:MAG: LON peptidase substrate-binding domain-containing protein, partial [Alistipes sp.]|nr:LON peptidase substrate-binding domain-containing protein [Alistipes sp.]
MSKKDKDFDEIGLVPELFDGKHQVIPIISGGDDTIEDVKIPEVLPILTLRNSVIFPGSVTPITVGRAKSIALVRAVEASDGLLGAVLQRDSSIEDPQPDDMYKVGTSARILKILEMPNGNLTVILNGLEKIEVGEYIVSQPYFKATVTT